EIAPDRMEGGNVRHDFPHQGQGAVGVVEGEVFLGHRSNLNRTWILRGRSALRKGARCQSQLLPQREDLLPDRAPFCDQPHKRPFLEQEQPQRSYPPDHPIHSLEEHQRQEPPTGSTATVPTVATRFPLVQIHTATATAAHVSGNSSVAASSLTVAKAD